MANRNGYGATPPVTETCLSFRQFDAADGYRGRRRRKGRQIWKRKTDLKCALAMVASEARLVVNDTVCCQLLHQIHSLIARLTLLLCAGKWRHHSTRLSSHKKTRAKERKKKQKSSVRSLPFLLLLLSLHNRSNSSKDRSDATLIRQPRRTQGTISKTPKLHDTKTARARQTAGAERDSVNATNSHPWNCSCERRLQFFPREFLSIFWKIIGKLFRNLEKIK